MDELIKRNNLKPIEEEKVNKTPYWTQRLASIIIDIGLLLVLMFGFISLLKISPLGDFLEEYRTEMALAQKDYGTKPLLENSNETFYFKVYIDEENKETYKDYYHYKDEESKSYVLEINKTDDIELLNKLKDAYKKALNNDKKYKASKFNYRITEYGINILSITMAEAILILAIPLINKRRVTIGQYFAGLRCVDSILPTKAKRYKIVWRFVYVMAIEVALPCLTFLGIYAVIIIPLISYIISLFNIKKREIRDFITKTRFIDNKTYEPIGGSKNK